MAINYNRSMSQRGEFITPRIATELVRRHINPLVSVKDVRKLYGGSSNRVLEFILDREPGTIVAKINDPDAVNDFKVEVAALHYFRQHTRFPVPMPMACIEDDPSYEGSILLLQKINGTTLEDAELSRAGKEVFQAELAASLIELHRHKADRFGPATGGETYERWLDVFAPTAEQAIESARGMLPSSSRGVLDHVKQHLSGWLNNKATPTLIHGDLWANNIIVNDGNPDEPRILAFIDGRANYADPEYELAYLQLFGTAGPAFFKAYTATLPIDPGYQHRSRVYWLVALLQQVTRYGERYIPQCERVISDLRRIAG